MELDKQTNPLLTKLNDLNKNDVFALFSKLAHLFISNNFVNKKTLKTRQVKHLSFTASIYPSLFLWTCYWHLEVE